MKETRVVGNWNDFKICREL